jgi:hypothetical protein
MKPTSGQYFLKKLKPKDQFEIKHSGISPEDEISDLVKLVLVRSALPSNKQNAPVIEGPPENLKTLVAIANNIWRAKTKMVDQATGDFREDLKRAGRHIEAIYRNLAEEGIAIRDHTGEAYDEGLPMKVVASKPTPGQDKKRVSETLLPSIFWKNRLVQNGEIEIAIPDVANTSGESENHSK